MKRRKSNAHCCFPFVLVFFFHFFFFKRKVITITYGVQRTPLDFLKTYHLLCQSRTQILAAHSVLWSLALRVFLLPREADRNVHNCKTKVLETSQLSSLTNVKFFLVNTGNLSYLKVEGEARVPASSLTSRGSFSTKDIPDHLLPNAKMFIRKQL